MNEELFEQQLQSVLFRHDCPSVDALYQYHESRLAHADQSGIKRHVEQCLHCRSELDELAAVDTNHASLSIEAVWEQIKRAVKEKTHVLGTMMGGNWGTVRTAAAVRRGETNAQTAVFTLEELGFLTLDVAETADSHPEPQFTVSGQLLTDSPTATIQFRSINQSATHEMITNENGVFSFVDVTAGLYHLHITPIETATIVVPFIAVGA